MQFSSLCFPLLVSLSFTTPLLPQHFEVISGSATSSQSGNYTVIENSPHAILHWDDFSIAEMNHLHFAQANAASSVLNRVTGSNLSALMGTLTSNGQVFLLNPNGVLIGNNAVIKTAGFLASTATLSNDQFLAGEELLFSLPSDGKIINQGQIECEHGHIFLIAREVVNEGNCFADFIGIGSALEVLIQPQSSQKLYIRPDPIDVGAIVNQGNLEAIAIEFKTSSAYQKAIRMEGSEAKLTVTRDGGRIILSSEHSSVEIDGSITAPGGEVQILGKHVALLPTGSIDVNAGTVSIEAGGKGIYLEGKILASQGSILINNHSEESPCYHLGTLNVSGPQGGSIHIDTTKFLNFGNILAEGTHYDGGSIEIKTRGPYLETVKGFLSVSGKQSGGSIFLYSDTSLFSSGTHTSQGTFGGTISLLAPKLTLVSAEIGAFGSSRGGCIFVGGGAHGEQLNMPNAETTHLSGDTRLRTSATESGDGGSIVVWSEKKTVCYGAIEANAGPRGGNGGWIEVSSKDELFCRAGLSAHAPYGTPGAVLLDPKNIIIDAMTGVYPQYEFIDPNSGGGSGFGTIIQPLSTGNVVVTKPNDNVGAVDAGAVYLYNGHTAALISTITGSTTNDLIGSNEITALTNGNFVFPSPNCNNGGVRQAGAATWGSGITGVSGIVSSSNSLVGSTAGDSIGESGAIALSNGNYVVASIFWTNGLAANAGAVTWGNGATGITGPVTSTNSLVGSTSGDGVGGVEALSNGNYVVVSSFWNTNIGAVTWGDGSTGITGPVTSTNSLVGSTSGDRIGSHGGGVLTNGNYVIRSALWSSNRGAVTWGNGLTGITGTVNSANSLVGTIINSFVGSGSVTVLINGNYVVASPIWNDGINTSVGAVTWGNGSTGITGTVSSANSLVGTTTNDTIGSNSVTALINGNYVVASPNWDDGLTGDVGAVTWGNGSTGTTGAVSSANSLVGTIAGSNIGEGVIALTNGNYVALSPSWIDGVTIQVGAATLGDGSTGITGAVSSLNSLIGSTALDRVGESAVALTNNNYVIISVEWDDGPTADVGAVTWGDGLSGIVGPVTSSNSLVGTTSNDRVGNGDVFPLTNGNYVVLSPDWNDGAVANVGAATWGDGLTGISGAVSSLNSLVGTQTNDQVGIDLAVLTNGNYVVKSFNWNNGAVTQTGAVSWGDGLSGIAGAVTDSNSLVGTTMDDFVGELVFPLSNGNYVVNSSNWHNGALDEAGAVTWGDGLTGISGAVTSQNSIVGQTAFTDLMENIFDDTVNGTFISVFQSEGSGTIRVGLQSPNQIDFSRAQAQDMTITPSLLTDTLNTGTAVTLQANNDITISSDIISTAPGGALTLSAGRSALINANITTGNGSLNITANDLLSSGVVDANRDPGDATLSVADGFTIDVGSGNLTLSLLNGAGKTNSGSGNLTIGNNTTLQCSGAGSMTLTAQEHDIVLGNNSLLQTVDGTILLSAGVSITDINPVTLQTTGTGELILITDSLFPTSPLFGNGAAMFPLATLATGGGRLLIYTSQRSLNSVPATINGTPYVPGPEFVNSVTEKWGTYYPNSSGIPFTIFYKQLPITPPVPPIPPSTQAQSVITNQGTLADLISSFISQQLNPQLMIDLNLFMNNLLFCDFNSSPLTSNEDEP